MHIVLGVGAHYLIDIVKANIKTPHKTSTWFNGDFKHMVGLGISPFQQGL